MSLTRQLLHDIRPLFRVLEEPFGRSAGYYALPTRSFFNDPFFQSSNLVRPSVDVTEEGNNYVVEADLPGVKKGNVEVSIGDGGRSLTIEGKIFRRGNGSGDIGEKPVETPAAPCTTAETQVGEGMPIHYPIFTSNMSLFPSYVGSDAVTKAERTATPISTERQGSIMTNTLSFSRTVWLPRVVDGSNVTAKLTDGVLTLTVPKANDKASTKVLIE
jgi:HSP20 family protein